MRNIYPVIARGKTTFVKESDTANSCILKKSDERFDDVYIVINPTDEMDAMSLSDLSEKHLKVDYELLANNISDHAKIKNKVLTLPPHSIIILK